MREIKFRAWNTNNNRMYHDVQNGIDLGLYIGFGDALIQINLKVMQYTGLKDKNGKEIYEGDIIQNIADDGTKLSSFEIKWIEEQCRFVKWKLENVDEGARYYDLSQSRFFTVIGNIYETPTP